MTPGLPLDFGHSGPAYGCARRGGTPSASVQNHVSRKHTNFSPQPYLTGVPYARRDRRCNLSLRLKASLGERDTQSTQVYPPSTASLKDATQEQSSGGEMGEYLRSLNIKAEFVNVPSDGTAASTADILNVPPEMVVKSLVFLADGMPVLVVACGNTRIDVAKLAAIALEDGGSSCTTDACIKKRVHLATVADAERITGYKIGSIPPFNLKNPGKCLHVRASLSFIFRALRMHVSSLTMCVYIHALTCALSAAVGLTIVDKRVMKQQGVYCGSGLPGVEMVVSVQDCMLLANAIEGDIVVSRNRELHCELHEIDTAPPQGVLLHAPGAEASCWVQDLEATVIWRSKIGRRLLFCGIVPAHSNIRVAKNHNMEVYRNVWRWDESCAPLCEDSPFQLQLIVGKTLTMRFDACDCACIHGSTPVHTRIHVYMRAMTVKTMVMRCHAWVHMCLCLDTGIHVGV
jgi:prolyl-tRNA editing enzyme YbaK/EbsC (Cys-tRNA(Pro) deacylase)